jgi:glycerophosphoryl diester phosphodiesterase
MYITLAVILFLFLILLFLIFPKKISNAKNVLLKDRYIAHRGLHNEKYPENSLSAFNYACEKGYAIEIDIHITKDDKIIVFHDNTLKRVCGVDIKPEEATLDELKEHYLFNSDEKIPTLEECLACVKGRSLLLIEFKCESNGICKRLCEEANKILSNYSGIYAIQSFYPFVLQWYKKNRPDIMRGQLATAFYKDKLKLRLLGALVFNFISRPNFISYEFKHKNNFFRRLCTFLGAYPVAWTYHDQEEIVNTKKYFKNFIFEGFEPKIKG